MSKLSDAEYELLNSNLNAAIRIKNLEKQLELSQKREAIMRSALELLQMVYDCDRFNDDYFDIDLVLDVERFLIKSQKEALLEVRKHEKIN
jgi:hypothetical protein